MKLFNKSTRRTARLVLALCLLVTLTQCSPPPPNPPPGAAKWGLAVEHDNVSLLGSIGGSSEHPAWSPDGTRIAFEHMEDRLAQGGIRPDHIYVINSDGTGKQRLTQESEAEKEVSCHDPSWAPDSRHLVSACNIDGDFDLYILDVTTGAMTRLTDYLGDEADPAWSPDGTHIAFEWLRWSTTATGAVTSSIYVIGSDGYDLKRLTMGPYDTDPAWSPDSQSISFTSSTSDQSNYSASEKGGNPLGPLCVIHADGSALICRDDVRCQNSIWSPDGSLVACASESDIIAIQIAGEGVITLLDAKYDHIQGLSWSPDGTRLVFAYGPLFQTANDLYILDIVP